MDLFCFYEIPSHSEKPTETKHIICGFLIGRFSPVSIPHSVQGKICQNLHAMGSFLKEFSGSWVAFRVSIVTVKSQLRDL